jgi:predicted phosphodiesterase
MTPFSNSQGAEQGVTVMAIGDVHLGTRPASLPPDLDELGVDPRELTPEAGLAGAVEYAIAGKVDAVLFAGDVVESTNARFEAMPPLENAVRQLLAENIPVYAVAGNHDVEALPRLASLIEGFTLLGSGGNWESEVLHKNGQPALELVGWSFPEHQVRTSPVADLLNNPLSPSSPGVPRLGVLHGDFNASGGPYAPFSSREVETVGLDGWVFGHIHRPSLARTGDLLHGYLGSLVGLDPSETGQHGPWLLRVAGGARIEAEHLPIAPLRWEHLDIVVGADEEPEDLADRLSDESEKLARTLHDQGCAPRALGVRIRLTGSSRHYDGIRSRIEDGSWQEIRRHVGNTTVFVNRVLDGLQLAVDLEEIALGDDPPALLARKLLALRRGGDEQQTLLDLARSELRATAESSLWRPLEEVRDPLDPLADEALRSTLEQAGTAALHALLAQRRSPGAEQT